MKTFQDNADRQWTVTINVDAVRRVRSLIDINLPDVLDDGCKLLAQLHDDPVLLVDVLYCVCKPEADAKEITDEDFGRSMAGDAIGHATAALLAELSDFFPNARQRAAMQELIRKTNTVADGLLEKAESAIQQLDPASVVETVLNQRAASTTLSSGSSEKTAVPSSVVETLTASSANSPESSASIPDG